MTGMAHRLAQAGYFKKGLLLALFAALFGNVLFSHQAAAGGPIMTGKTFIQGTDRKTGTTYNDPRNFFTNNTSPHIIGVYPGDQVTFSYLIQNWDPIPFISGDVAIEYHSTDFVGNDATLFSEPSRSYFNIIPGLPSGYWYRQQSTVTIAGPGSDTPGKQFCEYVQTNPTVYDFLDPSTLFTGSGFGVVLGLHKFNHNPDYITIPLPIITQLGGSFYLGGVMSCAEIAYNYDLTPSITPGDKSGSSINVSPVVTNTSLKPGLTPTYTQPTQWQITQFFATPGSVPASLTGSTTTSTSDPCTYLNSRAVMNGNAYSCSSPAGGQSGGQDTVFDKNGIRDPSKGGTPFPSTLPLPTPPNPNYLLCYVLSVNTYQPYQSNPHWRNSKVVCLSPSVPIHPKVQVLGDDLRAGGQILTAQAGVGTVFGSWAEYAAYSHDQATSFATASGLKGGQVVSSQAAINTLTFANVQGGGSSTFGNFASADTVLGKAPSARPYFEGLASSQTITGTQDISTSSFGGIAPYVNPNSALPLVLKATTGPVMTVTKGKTIIIVSKAPVEIASDIAYASGSYKGAPPTETLGTLADIPQVVIVAPSITIDANVTQIDAWLVTDITNSDDTTANPAHYINTCKDASATPLALLPSVSSLTRAVCSSPLTVNGPVITSHLYLNRTAGDDGSDQAAETFNNRGDAYLWAYNYATTNGLGLTTTKQTELPPRF